MDIATLDLSIADVDAICDIVRKAPPERFRMADYVAETACGTAACVAGWCALDGRFDERLPTGGYLYGRSVMLTVRMMPALLPVSDFCIDDDIYNVQTASWFVYGDNERSRASEVDDAPFASTPAEVAALGEDYALGMAEREAALNRLAIVRRSLVMWRAALLAQAQESAPSACASPALV